MKQLKILINEDFHQQALDWSILKIVKNWSINLLKQSTSPVFFSYLLHFSSTYL